VFAGIYSVARKFDLVRDLFFFSVCFFKL